MNTVRLYKICTFVQLYRVEEKTPEFSRLQIRLPTGNPLIHTFGAGESLAAVRLYVQLNRVDAPSSTPIRLQTNMPVKIFTEDDMQTPLQELGTVKSRV